MTDDTDAIAELLDSDAHSSVESELQLLTEAVECLQSGETLGDFGQNLIDAQNAAKDLLTALYELAALQADAVQAARKADEPRTEVAP